MLLESRGLGVGGLDNLLDGLGIRGFGVTLWDQCGSFDMNLAKVPCDQAVQHGGFARRDRADQRDAKVLDWIGLH